MKNERAPRTLEEAEFTVGYPTIPRRRARGLADLAYAVTCVLAAVAIGAMLAWSV